MDPCSPSKMIVDIYLFSAVGCPFPEPPAWGWLEQDGWDFNTVTVHCNHSEAWWKLVCNGNKWTAEGTVQNCSKGRSL